ncbi:unannotated protein [freshwater metagenome]|uniref:Unannotated protein n=1 Tax=freshwater metagenome TaxID=449393 RepID=A0A6J7SYK0_9ZZZZ
MASKTITKSPISTTSPSLTAIFTTVPCIGLANAAPPEPPAIDCFARWRLTTGLGA